MDDDRPILDYATPTGERRIRRPMDPLAEFLVCSVSGFFFLMVAVWVLDRDTLASTWVGVFGVIVLFGRAFTVDVARRLKITLSVLLVLFAVSSFSIYRCPHATWYGIGRHSIFQTGIPCGNVPKYWPWYLSP